jgi:hypothetical protein
MRALLVVLGLGLIALIHTPREAAAGRSARSAIFEVLYAPFALLPNGSGVWVGTAFAIGLILLAILLPRTKSKEKGRE